MLKLCGHRLLQFSGGEFGSCSRKTLTEVSEKFLDILPGVMVVILVWGSPTHPL